MKRKKKRIDIHHTRGHRPEKGCKQGIRTLSSQTMSEVPDTQSTWELQQEMWDCRSSQGDSEGEPMRIRRQRHASLPDCPS
jgi:hypothetical protein